MSDNHNRNLLLDNLSKSERTENYGPPKSIQEIIKETQADIRSVFGKKKKVDAEIKLTENA